MIPQLLVTGAEEFFSVIISVDLSPIDGPGNILGQAGPRSVSSSGGFSFPATGIMQFDSDDLDALEDAGSFGRLTS